VIAEIETDKTTVEMQTHSSGVLGKIVVEEGEAAPVGGLIAVITEPGEEVPDLGQITGAPATAPPVQAQTQAPAPARIEAPPRETTQAAAAPSTEVRASPIARRLAREKGIDLAQVNGTGPGGRVTETDLLAYRETTQAVAAPSTGVRASPIARRLAREKGIDLAQVNGTGPGGRVTETDLLAYEERADAAPAAPPPAVPPGLPEPSKIVPMAGMRKAIADHMRGSIGSTAQLSYFVEVDVTEAQRLRREISREQDQTLGLAHVLIKACAETLQRHPALNTVLYDGSILYFDQINVGVAVALEDGLIVPVVRDVENRTIAQIADETQDLAAKARDGKLTPEDIVGGTFTISVLGTVDGFTPILSHGQSAILGVGRSVEKPVVRSGEIVVREMMTFSLTADHQVIDGAVAAAFLRRLQQTIERPAALFG
jgi:pyruvate dehydrogenase E2 component (dihydrolipoamide acetyltransferase)